MQQTLFKVANHSNQGKDFENELETLHDLYRRNRLADVRKNPNNWSFISQAEYIKLQNKLPPAHLAKTGDGRYMQRVKSDVDFSGGGENFAIAFDSKVCSGNTFPLGNVESHQSHKMRERHRCRIITGAMVYMAKFGRVFFVPFAYLEMRDTALRKQTGRRAKKGTASISLIELEANAIEIPKNKSNALWDWYPQLVR